MTVEEESRLNQLASRRLHKRMDATQEGQWIGLLEGEVVATGDSAEEVTQALMRAEPNPKRGLVVQLGKARRKKAVILTFSEW